MSSSSPPLLEAERVSVFYGEQCALADTTLSFRSGEITALIGPSGCGKSTFLRALNLMNREIPGCSASGVVRCRGRDITAPEQDIFELRRSIGMVFQQPTPFRKSVYDNIALAPRRLGVRNRERLDALVERCLRQAALWEEVKDKLRRSALALSGGQQQRLCIARALATDPDAILLDEPCSALDPISTAAIEELLGRLAAERAIIIVTHSMEQARRVAGRTAFFYLGQMVETGPTAELFSHPRDERLRAYLDGAF